MSTYGKEGKIAAILLDTVTDFSLAMRVPRDHPLSGQQPVGSYFFSLFRVKLNLIFFHS